MQITIIRSHRRAKTVSARVVNGVLEVLAPAHISDEELTHIISRLQQRIEKKQQQKPVDDTDLADMAKRLNKTYFNNKLQWTALSWSNNQEKRYGSCTPVLKTIRISQRIATMPRFVQEYVVMHELAHLIEANHGPRFWRLVNQYPRTERARGYLMAVGLEDLDELPNTP